MPKNVRNVKLRTITVLKKAQKKKLSIKNRQNRGIFNTPTKQSLKQDLCVHYAQTFYLKLPHAQKVTDSYSLNPKRLSDIFFATLFVNIMMSIIETKI